MQRSKRIGILLGILAVVCLITFGVSRYEEHKEKIKNSEEIVFELAKNQVTSLSWEYENEKLSFHKGEGWIYDEDEAFPVSEEKINELLGIFESFGVAFIIEEVEDYGQYGLEKPTCTIQIGTEEESYEILLGDYSAMDEKRYVSIGDGKVYLVNTDPFESYELTLSDMIEHDETPILAQAENIEFSGGENYSIFYEEESKNTYSAEDMFFVNRNNQILPVDTDRVSTYLDTISSLDLTDYVSYKISEEDITAYGLDNPELTITVDYLTEDSQTGEEITDTFVLSISRDPKERKQEEDRDENSSSEEEEELTAYARVGESEIIYQITADEYRTLAAASYDDLRHKEVFWGDFGDVVQIDLSLEDKDYTITSELEDEDRKYYYLEEELDITNLRTTIQELRASSFTQEKPKDKEEISLTLYLENEEFPEINIQLYRQDGTYCLAVIDNEAVSLVARSYVVDLIEAVNAIVLK